MLGDEGYRRIVSLTFYIGEHDIVERQPRDADHARQRRFSGRRRTDPSLRRYCVWAMSLPL
jgi:hypothetical protein